MFHYETLLSLSITTPRRKYTLLSFSYSLFLFYRLLGLFHRFLDGELVFNRFDAFHRLDNLGSRPFCLLGLHRSVYKVKEELNLSWTQELRYVSMGGV